MYVSLSLCVCVCVRVCAGAALLKIYNVFDFALLKIYLTFWAALLKIFWTFLQIYLTYLIFLTVPYIRQKKEKKGSGREEVFSQRSYVPRGAWEPVFSWGSFGR